MRRLFILTKEKDGQAKQSVEKLHARHTQQRENIPCTYVRTGVERLVNPTLRSCFTAVLYGRALRLCGVYHVEQTRPHPVEGGCIYSTELPDLNGKNWHLYTHSGTMSGRGSTTCNSDAGTILMSASRPGWCHGLVAHRPFSSLGERRVSRPRVQGNEELRQRYTTYTITRTYLVCVASEQGSYRPRCVESHPARQLHGQDGEGPREVRQEKQSGRVIRA